MTPVEALETRRHGIRASQDPGAAVTARGVDHSNGASSYGQYPSARPADGVNQVGAALARSAGASEQGLLARVPGRPTLRCGGFAVMRLLPWTGEGGQPAYLTTDGEESFVSRFADDLEALQLEMAERLLHNTESAWTDRAPGTDMSGVVPHLCHALRDAVRVARSLRDRMPDQHDDDRSALANAALAWKIAPQGTDGIPQEEFSLTVPAGPWSVAYRWPADPICIGTSRRLLLRHLNHWGMSALADTAGLVLSELATNALRHASGPDDRLIGTRFERLPGGVRIEVHDDDEARPGRKEPSAEADSGRGLLLVDMLTGGRWGVSDRQGGGKLVWAECAADSSVSEVAP